MANDIEIPINEQKINDAFSIIASVGFLERQIYAQMSLLEEAVNNNLFDDVNAINKRIAHLYSKVEQEYRYADDFMAKYGRGGYEEKAILSGVK